jgi:hypothetical protein
VLPLDEAVSKPTAVLLPKRRLRPLLPQILLIMSLPLYLGYLIKHELLPAGVIFVVLYSWAILSFVLVPILCVVECVVLTRAWFSSDAQRINALRWHSVGLVGGLGAMLAALAVR